MNISNIEDRQTNMTQTMENFKKTKTIKAYQLMFRKDFIHGYLSYRSKEEFNCDKDSAYERGRQFAILYNADSADSAYRKGEPTSKATRIFTSYVRQGLII